MDRQTLAQEITQYLTEQGAVRVGFADLHGVTGASLSPAPQGGGLPGRTGLDRKK